MTKKLYAFDLDDTLVWHDGPYKARIRVKNKKTDRVVRVLDTHDLRSHELKRDQYYDVRDFSSSSIFAKSVKPIKLVIREYNRALESGHKTIIVTARADMDDKHEFGRALMEVGIDFFKTRVYRVGNFTHLPQGKARIIIDLIDSDNYDEVFFYDDLDDNLMAVGDVLKNRPNVRFHAFKVVNGIPKKIEIS